MTSPPVVVNGLVIPVLRCGQQPSQPASGEVRPTMPAPVPSGGPGTRFRRTRRIRPFRVARRHGQKSGAANAWVVLAATPADLVFIPTGSAAPTTMGCSGSATIATLTHRRAASLDGKLGLGLSDRTPRPVGLRQRSRRQLVTLARGAIPPGRRPGDQDRHVVRAESRDRSADLPVEERPVPRVTPRRAGVAQPAFHRGDAAAQPSYASRSTASGARATRTVRVFHAANRQSPQ